MDKDNILSDNELRTLGVHLHGAPLKPQAFTELKVTQRRWTKMESNALV